MKIKLTGPITSMDRIETPIAGKVVKIRFSIEGKVDGKTLASKEAQLDATLTLKPIVANELKLGALLNVVISDDGTETVD